MSPICISSISSHRWDQISQPLFTVFTLRLGYRRLKYMVRYLFQFTAACLNDDSFIPMYFISCMTLPKRDIPEIRKAAQTKNCNIHKAI